MKRRSLLLLAGAGTLIASAGRALPQTAKPRRIAYVMPNTQGQGAALAHFNAFRSALRDLGYVEDRDVSITTHWANDNVDRLPALAAEVVALKPEVIVTAGSAAVAACKKATSAIPIVFATAANPVEQGFVSSLRRPGGNITGVLAYSALHAKIVEIAREALPGAKRLAIIVHEADPYHKIVLGQFEPAARRLKFEPAIVRVARAEDLERALGDLAERKPDAVIVPTITMLNSNQKRIAAFGLKAKLPLLSPHDNFAAVGGLLSYGPSREENYRRAAALVDKILRGAKPGDLPVEQPERFQLLVNRKTAQAIGVTLSPVTMLRADRVID